MTKRCDIGSKLLQNHSSLIDEQEEKQRTNRIMSNGCSLRVALVTCIWC
jgi:hypothetical protein